MGDINSQSYISEDLIHFIGGKLKNDRRCSYSLLKDILEIGCLSNSKENAVLPKDMVHLEINCDTKLSENEMYVPQMVCFCDIPISQLSIHNSKYGKFGLAFSKDFIVENKGLPVHYIPKNARESSSICKGQFYDLKAVEFMNYLIDSNQSMKDVINDLHNFLAYNVFAYVKFFDHKLEDSDQNNFYFEREWRVLGNFQFTASDVKKVFVPKEYENEFKKACPQYCDRVNPL